jgi:mono/diheme cytochrome c family protein
MTRLQLTAFAGIVGAIALVTFGATAVGQIQIAQADADPELFAALMDEGAEGYDDNCSICHGGNGEGGVGPMLAGSTYAASNTALVSQIIFGHEEHGMPPFDHLSDREIAAIATFVRNSWGNSYGITPIAVVAENRGE